MDPPPQAPTPILPPSPDQLAMTFASAMIASGRLDNMEAAIMAAWWAVPEFYRGRIDYQEKIAPLYFTGMGRQEPEDAPFNSEAQNDADFGHMADLHAGV